MEDGMDAIAKLLVLPLIAASAAPGCCDDSSGLGADDAGAQDEPAGCDVDFADLASAPAVSLRNDVMHVFALSCALGAQCHGTASTRPMADLLLGPPCGGFDQATGTCTFATTPLTDEIVTQVWSNLVDVAAVTMTSPTVMRVAPRDPLQSFLLQKTAGIHEQQGYVCIAQDSTAATPCGNEMPPGQPLCLQDEDQARFNTIAKWILDGAENN
jgi:hypothetical protein